MTLIARMFSFALVAGAAFLAVPPPSAHACGGYVMTEEQLLQRELVQLATRHVEERLNRQLLVVESITVRDDRATLRVRVSSRRGEQTRVLWLRRPSDAEGWRVAGVSRPRALRTTNRAS